MRALGRFREAVAIAAHHHSVLQDHAVADAAVFADGSVRMSVEVVSNFGAFIDDHMRVQNGIASDGDVFPYHREGTDGRAFADPRGGRDGRLRMNTGTRFRRLIKQSQRAGEIVIGVRGDQAGGRSVLQGLCNQDRGRAAMLHLGRVF